MYGTRFTLNDRARLAAFLVVSSAEGEGASSDRPRHRSWIGRRFWCRHGIAGVGRVEGVDGGCEACGKRATGSSHWMSFTLQAPTYLRRLHAGRYRLRPPRLTALTLEPQHRWRQSSANGDTPALAASGALREVSRHSECAHRWHRDTRLRILETFAAQTGVRYCDANREDRVPASITSRETPPPDVPSPAACCATDGVARRLDHHGFSVLVVQYRLGHVVSEPRAYARRTVSAATDCAFSSGESRD